MFTLNQSYSMSLFASYTFNNFLLHAYYFGYLTWALWLAYRDFKAKWNLDELEKITGSNEELKYWDPFSRFINYKLEEVDGITEFAWLFFVRLYNYFVRAVMAIYFTARDDFFRFLNVSNQSDLARGHSLLLDWSRDLGCSAREPSLEQKVLARSRAGLSGQRVTTVR